MSRKLVWAMTSLIILIGVLGVAFKEVQRVKASGTIYIRADGRVEPQSAPIQKDGDTYTLSDNIYCKIVVERDSTVVDGAGYTLQGIGNGTGIDLSWRSNMTVRNMTIESFGYGIWLKDCSNNEIYGNNITANNWYGIRLGGYYSLNNRIYENKITNNYIGIWLSVSSNNSIFGNKITNNDEGVVLSYSSGNSISGNSITANIWYGIRLWEFSNNNSISGNNITAKDKGIKLWRSSSNSISGNRMTRNRYAVTLDSSSNNIFSENKITDNVDGIHLDYHSNNNNFSRNNIVNNDFHGILLTHFSNNNSIFRNDITNNGYGINLKWSSNNTISGNNITRNRDAGIRLESSCNNRYYHNNFRDNTQQVIIRPSGYVSFWDDGVEGNYWSNYTGVDLNHDGIGDSPHVIDENNQDNYPLMGMFFSFNTSLGKHVNVVSNSSIEDFEYFESNSTIEMYVSNVSSAQTFGFCRVCVPMDLMNPPYTVIIDDGLTEVLYFNDNVYEDSTHRWIYFAYEHSTNQVDIIPEFPSIVTLPIFMMATLLAVIVYRRKDQFAHFLDF